MNSIEIMMKEHDMGRLYMSDLREALVKFEAGDEERKLDLIANMSSYTHLLERHISRENEVVYPFGQKQLSPEILEKVHKQTMAYEEEAQKKGI